MQWGAALSSQDAVVMALQPLTGFFVTGSLAGVQTMQRHGHLRERVADDICKYQFRRGRDHRHRAERSFVRLGLRVDPMRLTFSPDPAAATRAAEDRLSRDAAFGGSRISRRSFRALLGESPRIGSGSCLGRACGFGAASSARIVSNGILTEAGGGARVPQG